MSVWANLQTVHKEIHVCVTVYLFCVKYRVSIANRFPVTKLENNVILMVIVIHCNISIHDYKHYRNSGFTGFTI